LAGISSVSGGDHVVAIPIDHGHSESTTGWLVALAFQSFRLGLHNKLLAMILLFRSVSLHRDYNAKSMAATGCNILGNCDYYYIALPVLAMHDQLRPTKGMETIYTENKNAAFEVLFVFQQ